MSAAVPIAESVLPQAPEVLVDEADLARAQWYGMLARLFSAPLNASELRALAEAGLAATPPAGALGQAFDALCRAARMIPAEAVKLEYDTVFIGTGRAEVLLNASFYMAGFLHEKPLVDLRKQLDRLGYARIEDIALTEDHLSLLCSVMHELILDRVSVHEQAALFREFLAAWFEQAFEAIERSRHTEFYKHVARLAGVFLAIERQSFDFED